MVIKKSQTKIEKFGPGLIRDYPLPDNKIGVSYQEHSGRVPEKGWGMNTKCLELYYVIEGEAEIFIDDGHEKVEVGDLIVINPNQKSYLVAKNLKLLTITSPNWYEGQYKEAA